MQAVIFDLDDTLYAYKSLNEEAQIRVQKFACHILGISKKRYEEAYQYGRRQTKNTLGNVGASHNRILYFQKTLEYLGKNPVPLSLKMYEIYWGTFLENMKLYDGVREVLNLLREYGCRAAVCTDLTAHIQHRKIEALGIADDISCLITSEEAGQEKPVQAIFQLCLEKLQLPPDEVWYVGDSFEKDIKGAVTAGMHAVWFQPEGAGISVDMKEGGDEGTREAENYEIVQDYGQLLRILQSCR